MIPANEWKSRSILAELKSSHKRTFRYAGPQIRKILVELERAKAALGRTQMSDCEQMIEMARRIVDQVQKIRRMQK